MSHLSLSLLGQFQAWNASGAAQTFRTLKERALLAYLVMEHGKMHRRDTLAELLWPDRPEGIARNNLRQALYGLRQAIGETYFPSIFTVTGEGVKVTLSEKLWLDAAAYKVHFKAAQMHPHSLTVACPYCMQHLHSAIELYRGSFLEDFHLDKNPDFQEWILFQREQFFRMQVQALDQLVASYEQMGDYAQAAVYAASQVRLNDTKEHLYRRLMTFLAKTGRFGAALDWYEICRQKLYEVYNASPSEETVALAEKIRAGRFEINEDSRYSDHNLPEVLTPFIGREMELAQIGRQLENPGCRLLTIVGMGGVGKTRLAINAARMNLHMFADGAYFVPLETVAGTEEMIEAIARTIGVVPGSQQETRSVLFGYLRLKHILLVLDNFDNLQDAKGMLLEILQAAPFVKIIVTSRERLRLQVEFLIELDGLPFPGAPAYPRLAGSEHRHPCEYAAVQLFLERAGRVRSGGFWDQGWPYPGDAAQPASAEEEQELEAVVRICQRFHGLPLGIELAAGLARDYSFAQIDAEVQRSFDFLQATLADLPERQRSLRLSFEHSWDLLSESEREVLGLLSIFPGSFSVEAARVVAGAAMPWLMRLEDRSLLRRVTYGRYELHPIIRQYAAQKLRQFSRRIEDQALRQHAEFFCALLSARERDLQGQRQAEALAEIEADLANIQAAWRWAVEHQELELVQSAAYSLMFFLEARSMWREGAGLFGLAAERLQDWARQPAARRVLGAIHSYLGWFHCRLTCFEAAETCLVRSLELLDDGDSKRERAYAHFAQGFLYTWMGRYREAWDHLATSHALAEEINERWGAAWAKQSLAEIAFESGQAGLDETAFLQTLSLFEQIGEQRGIGRALNYLGNIAMATGRLDDARSYYQRMLITMEKLGDVWGSAGGCSKLGQLALAGGDHTQALHLHRRSLQMFQKMGDQRRSAIAMREVAEASAVLGQSQEASEYFRQALEIAARLRSASLALDILTGLAAVMLNGQKSAAAAPLLGLVLTGSVADKLTRSRANRLLDDLRARHPAAAAQVQQAAAEPAEAESNLWRVVDRFLRDGVII